MFGGNNMGNMLKRAQQLQAHMAKLKEELAKGVTKKESMGDVMGGGA